MEKTIQELSGITIAALGQVKRITPSRYLVHSQSSDNWYEVKQKFDGNGWTYSCPDHIYRKVICEHLLGCKHI